MELPNPKIRKITSEWTLTKEDWYIQNGYIYIKAHGVTIGFDHTSCGFPDWLPNVPLKITLEIPCPPFPNTNPPNISGEGGSNVNS